MAHWLHGRFRLVFKGLRFTAITGGFAAVLTFFFYDGPVRMLQLLPTAEAVEAAVVEGTGGGVSGEASLTQKADGQALALPAGFQARWRETTLDGAIRLRTLARKFTLAQTEAGAGSEYYDYAASLFEQASAAMPERALSERLQALGMEAQTLGHTLRQAAALRYDAPPTAKMEHLQVRSAILFQLNDLSTQAHEAGPALSAFLTHVRALASDPAMARYPETMALVEREARLLAQLATHATLRWESTQVHTSGGDTKAVHVKVYVKQTLPESMLASATD